MINASITCDVTGINSNVIGHKTIAHIGERIDESISFDNSECDIIIREFCRNNHSGVALYTIYRDKTHFHFSKKFAIKPINENHKPRGCAEIRVSINSENIKLHARTIIGLLIHASLDEYINLFSENGADTPIPIKNLQSFKLTKPAATNALIYKSLTDDFLYKSDVLYTQHALTKILSIAGENLNRYFFLFTLPAEEKLQIHNNPNWELLSNDPSSDFEIDIAEIAKILCSINGTISNIIETIDHFEKKGLLKTWNKYGATAALIKKNNADLQQVLVIRKRLLDNIEKLLDKF